jgi:serine/threonine protein kinase
MATVYKAYQPSLDRYVAVKVLPTYLAHEPGFAARFQREARAIARLNHPHILPVHDFGQEGELSYIVMRYVEAGILKEMLGKPLDPKAVLEIMTQVGKALDYAHRQGIIHRDVKPSNVLMDEKGVALLADFGLAKMAEASVQLTKSGVGVGTPAYMSPEQGQGISVDARSDVYSLGITLYEMLTGRVPYEAETPIAVVIKHITAPLPRPTEFNPALPEPVERVMLKALAKNPADRFQSVGQMVEALKQAVAEAIVHAVSVQAPLERKDSVKATAQIFLSYAREDQEKVENLYQRLSYAGFKPWMDKKDILPGEKWKSSIEKAIQCSDFFLACLSANSVSKRGYPQKEIRDALDIWQEKLDSDIYLVPVRLEDCEVPETLRDFQWVNLFEEDGWTRLVKAIKIGIERRRK